MDNNCAVEFSKRQIHPICNHINSFEYIILPFSRYLPGAFWCFSAPGTNFPPCHFPKSFQLNINPLSINAAITNAVPISTIQTAA